MKVYLDNCCYNRPYDDQNQLRIRIEAQAKLHVQKMIIGGDIGLIYSYISEYENSKNPYDIRRNNISDFFLNATDYVGNEADKEIREAARPIMESGVKANDAYHISAAIYAKADFFLTTDDRVLKYKTDKIMIISPTEFIRIIEENDKNGK